MSGPTEYCSIHGVTYPTGSRCLVCAGGGPIYVAADDPVVECLRALVSDERLARDDQGRYCAHCDAPREDCVFPGTKGSEIPFKHEPGCIVLRAREILARMGK